MVFYAGHMHTHLITIESSISSTPAEGFPANTGGSTSRTDALTTAKSPASCAARCFPLLLELVVGDGGSTRCSLRRSFLDFLVDRPSGVVDGWSFLFLAVIGVVIVTVVVDIVPGADFLAGSDRKLADGKLRDQPKPQAPAQIFPRPLPSPPTMVSMLKTILE